MKNIIFRNSAKAIIVQDGRVLLLQKQHAGSVAFTVFPGGGQEPGETLPEALKRECIEEIGARVEVGELLFVREYRSWEHEFHNPEKLHHQMDFFFLCTLEAPLDLGLVDNPDPGQIGVIWVAVEDLEAANFYPKALIKRLPEKLAECEKGYKSATYLGSVN